MVEMKRAKNKLVIVEGLTGLGKSTLAHFITRQYQYNGISAVWIHEGEQPHPVSMEINSDIHAFMDEALMKWEAFVGQIRRSGEVVVIEASFFNNLIETLFAHCVSPAEIMQFGLKLQEVIKPVQPALIYLAHDDVSNALEKNFANRGDGFREFVIQYVARAPIASQKGWDGNAGVVAFWKEFVSIADALFHAYDIDKAYLDVSSGAYDRIYQQVTSFLSLSMIPDPIISWQDAVPLIGIYKIQGTDKTCTVQYENEALVTDFFANVKKRLIPQDKSTFIVEGWHFELCFEHNPSTEITTFKVAGRDIDYLKAVGMAARKMKE